MKLLRLREIIGDPKRGIPAMLPVGASTIWRWVAEGTFPQPSVRRPGITMWTLSDVEAWMTAQNPEPVDKPRGRQ